MSIAFDAFAASVAASATSLTYSHTVGAGSNRALCLSVVGHTTDLVTGATYNGVSMTLVDKFSTGSLWHYGFYLNAPAAGANNVVVSASGTCTHIFGSSASYTGVAQTGQPEANNKSFNPTSTTLTVSVTTLTNNAWTILLAKAQDGSPGASTGSTKRGDDGFGGVGISAVFDSNAGISPAASNSMSITQALATDPISGIMLSLAPFSAGGGPLAVGTAALSSVTATVINVTCGSPAGGTAPYTYQWYRSTASGFTVGGGNLLSGATTLTVADSASLVANTPYYYILRVTDNVSATVDSNQIAGQLFAATLRIGGVGDSVMAGYSLAAGQDPLTQAANYLQKMYTQKVVVASNQAISGTKTADWLSGTGNLIAAKASFAAASVTHILIQLGANDAATSNHVSAATYGSNLSNICTDLIGAGYTVVLNYPGYIAAGANAGATDAQSLALTQAYQAQIDALVNGSTIRRGDTLAFAYFMDHLSELQTDFHPTVTGAASLGLMWARAVDRSVLQATAGGSGGISRGRVQLGM